MNLIPFFVDILFETEDLVAEHSVPATAPIDSVHLGYFDGAKVVKYQFQPDAKGWADVSEWIRTFKKNGFVVPVGWNLRSVVWPALTLNLVREKQPLPQGFMMPLEKRWNDMYMVDLSSVVVQSGYGEWKPGLSDVHRFLFGADNSNRHRLDMLYDVYKAYADMNANAT